MLAAGFTYKHKDGTTKMREQRNEKNEKTEVVQKKWRKQRKAGKVQQVIDGGGVQVGACERLREVPTEPAQKHLSMFIPGTSCLVPGM